MHLSGAEASVVLRHMGAFVRRLHSLVLAACVLALHTTAAAQDGAGKKEQEQASTRFHRGVELFQDEAYRAALIEFERAYEISPDYRLLYNIGGTKLQLQDFLGASQAYERYLREGGQAIPRDRREEVEPLLRSLQGRVGRITVAVNRDGADVFVDDIKVGQTPITGTVSVNVGRHRVAVRAPDGSSDSQIVDVAGDEIAEVSIVLTAPKEVVKIVTTEAKSRLLRTLALSGWGIGGALLIGSITTGALAQKANHDLDTLLKKPNVTSKAESDQRDKLKTRALATDVLIGSGLAFAAAGTVMWFLDRRAKREDAAPKQASNEVRWDVGFGTVNVRGKF